MDWVRSKFQNRIESKSYDETNGLIFNNILLPEEIIILILSYTDNTTLLNCKLVCNRWNDIIKSNAFWRLKLHPLKKTLKKHLPWYVYYCLIRQDVFDVNLLKNCNGENKFKYWKINENGGWKIESTPSGADLLPSNVPEFKENQSCFSTSFRPCSKSQFIDLNDNRLLKKIVKELHPTIVVSEWFAGRFDCGCTYKLSVKLLNDDHQIIYESEENRRVEQWEGSTWSKVEIQCVYGKDIASKIGYIEFCHEGCDTQFWAGNYGSKMAGGVVKLSYDSL